MLLAADFKDALSRASMQGTKVEAWEGDRDATCMHAAELIKVGTISFGLLYGKRITPEYWSIESLNTLWLWC